MDLQTFFVIVVGLLIGIDIALLERSNRKLQRQLLEFATQRAKSTSVAEIKIECDNSQAMAAIAEIHAAAERAAGAIDRARGIVH